MPETAEEETLQQILQEARDAGYPVSRAQVRRYRDEGLLPRPRRHGLGRGLGIKPVYPAGSAHRVITIRKYLQRRRSFRAVRWALWWNGHPMPEEAIRGLLSRRVDTMVESRRAWLEGERDVVDMLEDAAEIRFADRLPGRLRLRTGRQRFPTFLSLHLHVVLGISPTLDDYDTETLAKGLRFLDQKQIESLLPKIAESLDPQKLQQALDASSWEGIEVARDELREAMKWIDAFLLLLGRLLSRGLDDALVNAFKRPSIDETIHLLLLWLSVKRAPWAQEAYESLLSLVQDLAEGRLSLSEALKAIPPDRGTEEFSYE